MTFVKLQNEIVITQYDLNNIVQSYGKIIDGIWRGIKYYNVNSMEADKLWNLIPKNYHSEFFLNLMSINSNIPPHTDSGILSTINVYIKPCDCVTTFYETSGKLVTEQVANQTNGVLFDKSCLVKIDEFSACANEVYLLDVTIPHEVTSKERGFVERIAMCLQSKTLSFEKVQSILTDTNQ